MRILCVIGAALALSGCMAERITLPARPPGADGQPAPPRQLGNWKASRGDSIDNAAVHAMWLYATRVSNGTDRLNIATLELICFKNEPVVRYSFGRFKIGSNRSASLTYRFDDRPPRDANVRFQQDYKTAVIEDIDDVRAFLDEMKTANKLLIRTESHVVGRALAEFHTAGSADAAELAYANCPLPPPAPPTAQSRKRISDASRR